MAPSLEPFPSILLDGIGRLPYPRRMATGTVDGDLDGPRFLQLIGHPLRWQLLGEIARSDCTVHELVALVDEPQNLVSYHLGKLRTAGLVSSRRSSADGRGAFYTADLVRVRDLLADTGTALHPGVRLVPLPVGAVVADAPARVLFACTGNSARSQMAEALANERSGGSIEASSAGSHPKPLHPNAVRAMRERYDIDLAGRSSTHLDVFVGERFDRVITLCDKVREVCPDFDGPPRPIHWSLADPAAGGGDDADTYPAFVELAATLETRVDLLIASVTAPDTDH